MIIVFFHMLYLIGKMMYENYHFAKRKEPEEVEKSQRPAYFPKKRHADDPFDLSAEDFENIAKAPRFFPPACIQRYIAVQKVLADPQYKGKIKKVVDFGCSELGFIDHLKETPSIEEILFVDVDRATLNNHMVKAIPVNVDYLQNRPNPLTIHVYEGSITQRDKKLANSDAVVAIELWVFLLGIEHLYPDALMDFPYNIFGYINPLVVVITTPNADFNVLFSLENEFRHWDHKFEWTRLQFEDWANNIVSRYPEYQVSFQGIGSGPPGNEHLGCCTQMAVFNRVSKTESLPICGIEGLFKSVTCQEYPYRIDNRSDEQKILDEASYYMRRFSLNNPECTDEYPLKSLLMQLEQYYISAETLREILVSGGLTVVDQADGPVILCPPLSTFSDTDDELIIEVNDDVEDVWNADSGRESAPYLDNFVNAETMYEDKYWDGSYGYEIPAINLRVDDETHNSFEALRDIAYVSRRSPDTEDLDGIEVSNDSPLLLVLDSIEPIGLSSHSECLQSVEDETRDHTNVSSNIPSIGNPVFNHNQNSSVECKTEAVTSTSESNSPLSQIKSSSAVAVTQRREECWIETEDSVELGSLCSMYLEASRNEDRDVCPENITNPSFDCTALESSLEESRDSVDTSSPKFSLDRRAVPELQIQGQLSMPSALSSDVVTQPNFASSPKMSLEYRENPETQKSTRCEDPANNLKSVSQTSLQMNGNVLTATTSSNSSFTTLPKFNQPEQSLTYRIADAANLNGGNEISDNPAEEITSDSGDLSPSESLDANNVQENLHVTRLVRQRAPESLELRSTTNSKDDKESLSVLGTVMPSACSREACTKACTQQYDVGAQVRVQTSLYVDSIVHTVDESLAASTHKSSLSKIEECIRLRLAETSEGVDATSASPDAPETPPNSWSPEIMDSGYPNSSFTQDMTPEYDLSSIAQDRVSDSESPSVAEAPRLGFVDHVEVENGDLANNNRDDEGNNMMAEAENHLEEDLQPLIDVLENDLENENDIYALENGFPVWLLRILERGNAVVRQAVADRADPGDGHEADVRAVGDAGIPDLDEGFDSTSSEDENLEEVSTESSEETIDWNASGDYY